jgi:hypothetical protein
MRARIIAFVEKITATFSQDVADPTRPPRSSIPCSTMIQPRDGSLTQANVVTTDNSDWATHCLGYKVTAVQISPSNGPTEWQKQYHELSDSSRRVSLLADSLK